MYNYYQFFKFPPVVLTETGWTEDIIWPLCSPIFGFSLIKLFMSNTVIFIFSRMFQKQPETEKMLSDLVQQIFSVTKKKCLTRTLERTRNNLILKNQPSYCVQGKFDYFRFLTEKCFFFLSDWLEIPWLCSHNSSEQINFLFIYIFYFILVHLYAFLVEKRSIRNKCVRD